MSLLLVPSLALTLGVACGVWYAAMLPLPWVVAGFCLAVVVGGLAWRSGAGILLWAAVVAAAAFGGVLVGASGNTKVVKGRFIGNFDDNDYVGLGELPLGQYSLHSTSGYPKTMYCILQLVESDQDDADAARELTSALSMIATVAVSAAATPAAGAIAGAVVNTIGG